MNPRTWEHSPAEQPLRPGNPAVRWSEPMASPLLRWVREYGFSYPNWATTHDARMGQLEPSSLDIEPAERPGPSPVEVYLASLDSPSSRITMQRSLELVVRIVAEIAEVHGVQGDTETVHRFCWERLDHRSTIAIRSALASRYAPATTNKHLASVRGVVRTAALMGLMEREQAEGAVAGLRAIRGETLPAGRMITVGEMEAMFRVLAAAGTPTACRDAALLAVLAGTGARRAEISGLDVEDWIADVGELVIRHGKGSRQRKVYLHGGAAAAVEAWLDLRGRDPGPMFVAVRKDGLVDPQRRRLSTTAIWRRCQWIAERAGVPSASPHDHRRTVASVLLDQADIAVVAGLLGHRQVTTTARYDRRPAEARRRAAELIHVPYVPPGG